MSKHTIKLVEDWKAALDKKLHVGAVLMDLSKAFDCLPHDLLVRKLVAYGLEKDAADLLLNYLSNRKQRVKIGNNFSTWLKILKGVPQGSILGPFLFNVFINDIFYWLKEGSLYNYADDNTLCDTGKTTDEVKVRLEISSSKAITWFHNNSMLANPDKFQAIFLTPGRQNTEVGLEFEGVKITSEEHVKLLGVEIDNKLNFNFHIANLCRKSATQLNVLRRLSEYLDIPARLAIFRSFIMTNFNFCPVVWHFCGSTNTLKLEKIQERGLRFVYQDYESEYEILCTKAGLTNLHLDRIRKIALEVYKSLNKLSPQYLHDLFQVKEQAVHLRKYKPVTVPKVRTTTFGLQSIRFEGANIWKALPNETKKLTSLKEFSTQLKAWKGYTCKCSLCKYSNSYVK